VVCETLTNVAKHARAGSAVVRVDASGVGDERVLSVEVRDDGVGGADLAKGHGLAGLVDRVEGLGGLLSVTSPEGGPTVVRATLPWGRA
jgi:signal transduction histidine kinase